MSNYNNDYKSEQIVGNFLDKYFYPQSPFNLIERVSDIELQYKGIDVLAEFKNKVLKIDEKAVIGKRYKKITDLKTFSMELSFLNPNYSIKKGWFFSKEKETSHYLFCWLDRVRDKDYIEDVSDIYFIEVMLIDRMKLLKYINNEYGLSPNDLLLKSEDMRRNNISLIKLKGLTRIYMSAHLPEEPVNLLIDKKELKNLSTIHQIVKPN